MEVCSDLDLQSQAEEVCSEDHLHLLLEEVSSVDRASQEQAYLVMPHQVDLYLGTNQVLLSKHREVVNLINPQVKLHLLALELQHQHKLKVDLFLEEPLQQLLKHHFLELDQETPQLIAQQVLQQPTNLGEALVHLLEASAKNQQVEVDLVNNLLEGSGNSLPVDLDKTLDSPLVRLKEGLVRDRDSQITQDLEEVQNYKLQTYLDLQRNQLKRIIKMMMDYLLMEAQTRNRNADKVL